jgi:hypothetical protein
MLNRSAMRKFKPSNSKLLLKSSVAYALVACCALTASAFTLNSADDPSAQGWADPHVTFSLNPANCPSSVNSLIDHAMAVWNGVATSNLVLARGAQTSTTFAQLNAKTATDVPVIICDKNFSQDSGFSGAGIAGVAIVYPPAKGAPLTYAYLLINVEPGSSGNIAQADPSVVEIVLAHEMGHVLGLGHSQTESALMYFNASAKTELALSQDDIDGISYLYPRHEPPDKMMGCGSVVPLVSALKPPGSGPPSSPRWLAFLLFCAPLLLCGVLRRRDVRVSEGVF